MKIKKHEAREEPQKQLSTEMVIGPNSAALTLPAGFSDQNRGAQDDSLLLPIDLASVMLSKTKWLYKSICNSGKYNGRNYKI